MEHGGDLTGNFFIQFCHSCHSVNDDHSWLALHYAAMSEDGAKVAKLRLKEVESIKIPLKFETIVKKEEVKKETKKGKKKEEEVKEEPAAEEEEEVTTGTSKSI